MNERFSHIPVQDPLNKPSPGIILLQRPNSQPQPPPEEPNPNFPPAEQQLDETILAAINNQRDRSWVLQLECDLEQFLRDPKVTRLDLPQIGSYQRLVVHRVAQYFNLDHAVIGPQGAKRAISLFKNPQSALPPIRLASLVPQQRELVPVQIQQPPTQAKSVKILPRIAKPEPAPVVEPKQPTPTKKPSKGSNKTLEQREEDYAKARARIFSDSEPALTQIAPNPGNTPPSTPTNLSDPDLSNPTNTSESPSSTPSSIRSSSPIEPQQNNSERESSDHSLKEKEKPQNFPGSSTSDNKEPRESNPKKRGSKKKPQSYKDPNASHVNSYAYSRQRGNVNPNKPINNSYSRGGPKTFARGDRMHSYSDPNVPLYNSHPWTDPAMIPAPWPRDNRTVPVVPYSNAPNFYYTGTFQKPIYQPSYNPHAPYMPVPSSGEMTYPQANLNQYHMHAFPPSFSPHGYPQPSIEEQFQRMDLHGAPMEKFGFAPGNVDAPPEPIALDPNCTVEIRFHGTNAPVSLDDPRFTALRNRGAVIQFLSPSNIWIGVFPSFDATQQAIAELSTDLFDVLPLNSHL